MTRCWARASTGWRTGCGAGRWVARGCRQRCGLTPRTTCSCASTWRDRPCRDGSRPPAGIAAARHRRAVRLIRARRSPRSAPVSSSRVTLSRGMPLRADRVASPHASLRCCRSVASYRHAHRDGVMVSVRAAPFVDRVRDGTRGVASRQGCWKRSPLCRWRRSAVLRLRPRLNGSRFRRSHAPAPVCRPADHEQPAPSAARLHDEVAAAAVSARASRPSQPSSGLPSSRGLTTQHMCGQLAWKRENRPWMEDATSFRKQTRSCLCQAMMRACARRSGVQRL